MISTAHRAILSGYGKSHACQRGRRLLGILQRGLVNDGLVAGEGGLPAVSACGEGGGMVSGLWVIQGWTRESVPSCFVVLYVDCELVKILLQEGVEIGSDG